MSTINLFRSMTDNRHETIHAKDNIPIQEAIKEDLTNAVIAVNGFERDENYRLQEGDLCTIRLFPDGDDAPALLTGSALGFVVGLLVGGPIGAVIGAITGAGVSAGAGALIDFLAPQQPDLKSPEAIKSIPQLRGAKNQSNYNKPIPIVLGKHLYTPMYIGMPYTEIGGEDGEDQYFNALFLLGYGKLQVRDIKLGILGDLCSNEGPNATDDGFLFFDGNAAYEEDDPDNNPKLELRQGASEVGLYPQKVFEEQLSIELTNFVDDNGQQKILKVPRFTARDPMKVQVEFTFGGGLIRYNDEGKKRDATVDICIQWKKPQEPDADYSWKPFGKIGIKPGGTYEAGITYNNGTSTITRQKSKVMRFIAEKEFTYSEVKDAVDRTIELRVFRASAQDINNTRISDKAHLTAIRTWCFDYGKSSASNLVPQAPMLEKYRDKTCRLGFRIKASGAVQGTLDALNCVLQSYGRTWDGENWTDPDDEDITQNPASIALKLLQSPSLGSKAYPDSMLDLNSFGAFYKWCNDKNFSCNGVLTSKKKVDDILAMVLETGRAIRILNGHQYGVLIDQPREAPVTILNSQNVLEASNQKAFADLPDGLCVNFINEADGYSQNEAYAMHDGSKQPGEGFIETIDMPFVTNYDQVYKNAMYQLACRHLRPEVWMRKLGIYGHLIALGDRVEVQDDTILVGIGEGAAITDLVYDANGNMTGIQTDGLFDVTDASQRYGVKITQYDGVHPPSIRTKEVTTPGTGVYSDFVFAAPIATTDPLRPSIGDFVSFGVYDRITTPALCFGKKDNGDGTFDVTLVPYQEGIYTADSGSIPEFDSKLTPPQKLAGIPEILPDTVTREEAITIAQDFVAPGPPATVYQLIPGATVIKRYNTGVIEPPTISCAQQSITGDAPPVTSNKTLKYVTERAGAETLYKGPAPVGDWEFIEFRLYDDSGVLLDRESIPVLTDGPPATVYHLIPSVPMIVRNPSGVAEPSAISCAQQVVVGNKPPEPSGKTIVYCTSANQEETDYTGAVPVAWDWIEFRLRDGETLLDQERVFVLSEGEPARTYKVQPSVSVIKVYDGVADPYKISCSQASITGNGLPVPSNKTLKYATSAIELVDAGKFEILHYPGTGSNIFDPMLGDFYPSRLNVAVDEQPYTGEITVNPAWGWIEFRLYDGDILLDKERVPVLADGAALIYMDLADQHITVRADEYGKPYSLPLVTQATLYNGNTPITNVDFMAKVAAKNIVHYPGNIFDPMLGDFYPVRLEQWSVSQGAIDQNGLITIAEMPEDQAEITVRALYDGVEYTAMLTLIKVKDGESPAIIDIENENASIACDSYGVPFPGELPFVTKALFYKGTEPAAPFWHLNTPIRGVSIAQDGTITVAEDAELDRSNNILALAAYRGKTYSRMFTLTKTLEGFTATVYELLPGARVVRRDASGNNTPEALSCAQQKIVGNGDPEPAGKTLVYVTSASSEETPYTGPVPVGSLSWIEFRLYSGNTILDRERVPVVSNGTNGTDGTNSITLDLENENTTVPCDAYGVPYPDSLPITARATLYDGWDEAAPAWSLESAPVGVTIA
ncbi:MAG: hypothetical protein LBK63_12725, partial [Treponema sp.]|nr:hypothetical protein [Treponema sp.]